MNWTRIEKNNHGAFIQARNWWGEHNTALVSCTDPIVNFPKTIRDLYEFFDLEGIHIEVGWLYEEMTDGYDFEAKIYTKDNYPDYTFCSELYDKRIEAENEAFEEAFEILQERINKSRS